MAAPHPWLDNSLGDYPATQRDTEADDAKSETEMAGERSTTCNATEDCSICFEVVGEAAMQCVGVAGGLRHVFHGRCLSAWVEECRRGHRPPSCPNCRGPVEIHMERLASQSGANSDVRDFLAQHAPELESQAAEDGWVRVPIQPVGILDILRARFQTLDNVLTTTRSTIPPEMRTNYTSRHDVGGETDPHTVSWPSRAPCPLDAVRCCSRLAVQVGGGSRLEVYFPFPEILDPQKVVIEKVVQAALEGRNLIIESPTGTGKTMALLCATLAAQRHLAITRGLAPRIVFCTRTHHQVKQVVREARRSPYCPWMQVVAGRKQGLCIERSVLQVAQEENMQTSQVCRLARRRADENASGRRSVDDLRILGGGAAPSACRFWRPLSDNAIIAEAHRRMRTSRPLLTPERQSMAGTAQFAGPAHEILDVEDLGELGRHLGACPYFLSRVALNGAELVVCPYNYVLEPQVSKLTGLLEDRPIVVIDEGHNLEDHCMEQGSFTISGTALDEADRRLDEASRYLADFHSGEGLNMDMVAVVRDGVRDIRDYCRTVLCECLEIPPSLEGFQSAVVTSRSSADAESFPCRTWNSTREAVPHIEDFLQACRFSEGFGGCVELLQEQLLQRGSSGASRLDGLAAQVLKAISDVEAMAAALDSCRASPAHYKVHLEAVRAPPANMPPPGVVGVVGEFSASSSRSTAFGSQRGLRRFGGGGGSHGRVRGHSWSFELSVLLMQPEVVFANVASSAHSVIVASGTLAPLASFAVELGTAFAGRLLCPPIETPHVIHSSQLGVAFVGRSKDGVELRCVREFLAQRSFLLELGRTLLELVAVIPGGVLVFLPSFATLEAAIFAWRASSAPSLLAPLSAGAPASLWENFVVLKGHVAAEQGQRASGALALHEQAVTRDGSALLFCVYRGRSSEGISLSDNAVRGVICVGIPLPPLSPAVRLKREYNDALARRANAISLPFDGEAWYNLGAYRAVNQALGRVVRHRSDYGVAILLDARWTASGSLRAVKYLPLWLRRLLSFRDGLRGEALGCTVERLLPDLREHFRRLGAATSPFGNLVGGRAVEEVAIPQGEEAASRRVRPRMSSSLPLDE